MRSAALPTRPAPRRRRRRPSRRGLASTPIDSARADEVDRRRVDVEARVRPCRGLQVALEDQVLAVVDDGEEHRKVLVRRGPQGLRRVHGRAVADDAEHRSTVEGERNAQGGGHSPAKPTAPVEEVSPIGVKAAHVGAGGDGFVDHRRCRRAGRGSSAWAAAIGCMGTSPYRARARSSKSVAAPLPAARGAPGARAVSASRVARDVAQQGRARWRACVRAGRRRR